MILTYGRTLNERFNIIGRILRRGNHDVHPSSNCASIIALHSHLFSLSAIYCVCFAYEDLHLLFLNLYYSKKKKNGAEGGSEIFLTFNKRGGGVGISKNPLISVMNGKRYINV